MDPKICISFRDLGNGLVMLKEKTTSPLQHPFSQKVTITIYFLLKLSS
jgi:hypothetical protein